MANYYLTLLETHRMVAEKTRKRNETFKSYIWAASKSRSKDGNQKEVNEEESAGNDNVLCYIYIGSGNVFVILHIQDVLDLFSKLFTVIVSKGVPQVPRLKAQLLFSYSASRKCALLKKYVLFILEISNCTLKFIKKL